MRGSLEIRSFLSIFKYKSKQTNMNIKPKKRVVYECYIGGKDVVDNRLRRGDRVTLEYAGVFYYYFKRESGRGNVLIVEKSSFTKHFIPAAK